MCEVWFWPRRVCNTVLGFTRPWSDFLGAVLFPAVPFTCQGLTGSGSGRLMPVMRVYPYCHEAWRRILLVADQSSRVSALCTSCDSGKERVPNGVPLASLPEKFTARVRRVKLGT